ncbi:TnsD family Tn7-like transposition protein [Clostridium magnum]|uniref:Uncharacterized protein n=1 Tax=Clostridium magnum DSM 2767 TaxID=1121326 RepID=A0A162TZ77_9CLOT|nr:TnsD family Tn7-like transposition protein [Clostridium magnum]KZL93245.1 hypothetical protein CLMAG_02680 [Clostridium magnum DSM 2767]SHI19276.1 TniQ protein [Clostridium magnum DSM 2767]
MFNIVLEPYPDEIFYSWIARLCKINLSSNNLNLSSEMFGKSYINPSILYPTNLNSFISHPAIQSIYKKETVGVLIKEHTLVPFFTFFMRNEDINTLYKAIRGELRIKIDNLLGISKDASNTREIRFCDECVEEDKLKYGESYIHRFHQIPGNHVCLRHMKMLNRVSILSKSNKNKFLCLDDILDEAEGEDNISLTQEMINLAIDMKYIVSEDFVSFNLIKIIEKYDNALKLKGYKSAKGLVFGNKLTEDLKRYYSIDFLSKLDCNLNYYNRCNWINDITRNKKAVHPAKHLLFIRFLFGSVERLMHFENKYEPFGNGPWPCMNPIASHYKENVISECIVYKNRHTGKANGKFICKCGFIYTRKETDDYERDKYEISQYVEVGEQWNNKLKELLMQEKPSILKIARIMKCNESTIVRHAVKLGFKHKINRKLESNEYNLKSQTFLIEKYRNRIKEYINENPDKSRNEILKNESTAYKYLLKYDKEWMYNNLNITVKSSSCGFNYDKRDKEISKKIKVAIDYLLHLIPPIQITLASISRQIDYHMLGNKAFINKLPLTKRILEENVESKEEFRLRKNKYIAVKLLKSGVNPNFTNIARHTSINKEEYTQLKLYIDSIDIEI